jgi:quercetin dioxygenase-like cupin family protein
MKSLLLSGCVLAAFLMPAMAHNGVVHGPAATNVAATAAPAAEELHHTVVPGDSLTWGPAPPSLPAGAQAAALLGSPGKEGPFVLRLKFPAGFIVPPHRHSKDEFVVVLSGSVTINSGEKVNEDDLRGLPPGSFFHLPAGMAHYLWSEKETIVQLQGMGPFDVKYIDPKDDPRNK